MMDHQEMQDLLARALAGVPEAQRGLVDLLTPVIQKRVVRALLSRRQGAAAGRDVHQEVADLAQDIFLYLFSKNARVLRSWDPELGLSLPNFVGFVAEKKVRRILHTRKLNPWPAEPTPNEDLDSQHATSTPSPERVAISRESIRKLRDQLKGKINSEADQMFELLFEQGLSPNEVARRAGKSLAAVYKWRSRLRRLAQEILDDLSNPGGK